MKTYQAKRTWFIKLLLFGAAVLPLGILFFDPKSMSDDPYRLLVACIPGVILAWIYCDTVYIIDHTRLKYRSGFIQGIIEIGDITKIIQGKTLWSGIKPALATKGLIIKRKHGVDIYIAPEDNNEMIADLLKVNSDIIIR